MRHAVLAAAVAFHPRIAWIRGPWNRIARYTGALVMRTLDRRRQWIDGPTIVDEEA